MDIEKSGKQLPGELIPLFSDRAASPSLMGKERLFDQGYSVDVRIALWLEYFLTAGMGPLKEKWSRQPEEEQKTLGIEILKYFLFQPVFIRLFPGKKPREPTNPHLLSRQGKVLTVKRGAEPDGEIWFYYPLVHHRLWPDLLTLFQGGNFSFEEVVKGLGPELAIAASSRLIKIRQRAETLDALFRDKPGAAPSLIPEGQLGTEKPQTLAAEDVPVDDPGDAGLSEGLKTDQAPTPGPDLSLVQPAPPKKKKKKKASADQMKLF